jgi:hypothetical protein
VVLDFLMGLGLVIVELGLMVLLLLTNVWLDILQLGINTVPLQNMDVIHNGLPTSVLTTIILLMTTTWTTFTTVLNAGLSNPNKSKRMNHPSFEHLR